MDINLILFIVGLLILLALLFLIYVILIDKNKKEEDVEQDKTNVLLLNLVKDLRTEFQESGSQNRQEIALRLDQIFQQISSHQQNTSRHLLHQNHNNTQLVKDITDKLSQIESTNRQILGFAEQMKSLENILQNPKQRGILGEYFLENLLINVLQPQQYKMQYRFANGYIVDAAIFFKDKIVPVDAKFSLEKYNRFIQNPDKREKRNLEKAFRNDIKLRINETAKYIRPMDDTTDFALMFIPAEGIFHYLLNYKITNSNGITQSHDLIEYAFGKRVILVSPSTFYAYLQTILQGLKALEIEESVKEVINKVHQLNTHLKNYEVYFNKVGKQIDLAKNAYQQADKELKSVEKDILNITEPDKYKPLAKQGDLF